MAIGLPGPLFGSLSGTIGGINICDTAGGAVIRGLPSKCISRSKETLRNLAIVEGLRRTWRYMSYSEQAAWNTAAGTGKYSNRLGGNRQLAGYNLFLQQGYAFVREGGAAPALPLPVFNFTVAPIGIGVEVWDTPRVILTLLPSLTGFEGGTGVAVTYPCRVLGTLYYPWRDSAQRWGFGSAHFGRMLEPKVIAGFGCSWVGADLNCVLPAEGWWAVKVQFYSGTAAAGREYVYTGVGVEHHEAELLTNGNFELPAVADQAPGWTASHAGFLQVRSGGRNLQYVYYGRGAVGWWGTAYFTHDGAFSIESGVEYWGGFWYQLSAVPVVTVQLVEVAGGATHDLDVITGPAGVWTFYSIQYVADFTSGAVRFRFKLVTAGVCDLLLDDVWFQARPA